MRTSRATHSAHTVSSSPLVHVSVHLCCCSSSAKLTDVERGQLGAYLVEKKFNDKDRIITQGELGLGFYIITRGEVVVTLKNDKGVTSELGRLKEGDYFGQSQACRQTCQVGGISNELH